MSDIESAAQLYEKLAAALDTLKEAGEVAGQIEWFAETPAAPHLNSAAQSLFVSLNRLEKAAIGMYGEDVWRKLVPASDSPDA
jgi:hypothetical protein